MPRHDRIIGRSDDMFIYKAVNIYPSQIDHVLSRVDGIGSEYQIHLEPREDGRDRMVVKVERGVDAGKDDDQALGEKVAGEIRKKILVRCSVEILDYGSLPRTERKSKRVFDKRNGEVS